MNNNNSSLIAFKAISNFTQDIGQLFSRKHRGLKLYCRLINKTTLSHENAIEKHIDAFNKFCVGNREAIIEKNYNKFTVEKVSYSSRVFINIKEILKNADKDTSATIWKHILYISALVDPAGNAKKVLKENMNSNTGSETQFLTDIISKVEEHVDPSANPMDAVSSIMKSGIFTELMGGMNNGLNNGQLDLGKLMGAVQGMVSTLSQQNGGVEEGTGGEGGDVDPMQMITKMMGMMGNMGNMEDKTDTKTENISEINKVEDKVNVEEKNGVGSEVVGTEVINKVSIGLPDKDTNKVSVDTKGEVGEVGEGLEDIPELEEISDK